MLSAGRAAPVSASRAGPPVRSGAAGVARPVIPPQVPLIWGAGDVLERLKRMELLLLGVPTVPGQRELDWKTQNPACGQGCSPRVKAWAEECGIVFGVLHWHTKPFGRCTACGGLGTALQYLGPREAGCWSCVAENDEEKGHWWVLGRYACGIRLGLTSRRMKRSRQRLLEFGARRAKRAKSTRDLVLLAAIGALVAPELQRRVIPVSRRDLGLWPAVQTVYPHVLIDNLLSREAYFDRFATS